MVASGPVNPDLVKERKSAQFNVNRMAEFLYRGREPLERRRYLVNLILSDKRFDSTEDYPFMSRTERYRDAVRKGCLMYEVLNENNLFDKEDFQHIVGIVFPHEASPFGLHTTMFLPTIINQATEEIQNEFLPKMLNLEIIGTYAQTELGHGTFLRGLETTATYDVDSEEFVINSPTLTSTKWWPGGLGKTSNYAVVMAKLLIHGKDHGLSNFIVQLRDLKTHEPLKGITIGDIGPKFGYDSIDNGFLRFDKVRIPRKYMLMKNQKVLPDGTYQKAVSDKLSYGTMVFVRAVIAIDSANSLAQAVTIVTRYSCVRHQSEIEAGQPEPQVIEFKTQQNKIFPAMATSYAFWLIGLHMVEIYNSTNEKIHKGNTSLLAELHALSAGVKAFTSSVSASLIEQCRMACGGHGYSQASGIPKIYVYQNPACTYEGETTVMFLQTARYLMKKLTELKSGSRLTGYVSYLCEHTASHSSIDGRFRLWSLVEAYQHRALRIIRATHEKLEHKASQMARHHAWNETSLELVRAAKAHCHFIIVKNFVEAIASVDPELRNVLEILCQLYALHGLCENAGDFLEDGFLSHAQLDACRREVGELFKKIRPNAVGLMDAFDYSDRHLGSVLGRYDGRVYENLVEWAKKSPLNNSEVHESFEKHIKPLRASSKL